MSFDKFHHHRRSIRLKGWDYGRPGAYYVTLCLKGRVCYFGEIKNRSMILSKVGNVAELSLIKLSGYFPYLYLDEYIVMPNHIHAILFIMHNVLRGEVKYSGEKEEYYKKISPKKGSISVIIRNYKGQVKTWCNNNDYGDFSWLPRFHDRIIRSNEELIRIRRYIRNNPKNWDTDDNNPMNIKRI